MSEPKKMKYAVKEENNENGNLKSIQIVESLQDELNSAQETFDKQVIKLEKKLEIERKPMYAKREEAIGHIPNFWMVAMMKHPDIAHLLNDAEEEYLLYLTKLECEVETENDTEYSFKICLYFRENPFFKNSFLMKEYICNGLTMDKSGNKNAVVTEVAWKEGHDASQEMKEKKSFFYWLTTPDSGLNDFDIAQAIKEDLWANPLPYFLLSDDTAENSGDDSDEDVIIIDDSDEGKSPVEEPDCEEEESDNESECESPSSAEVPQNET